MVQEQLVEAINNSPYKIYMAITGGGTGFIGDFLKFGGGSQTILGYEVPYHPIAFDALVGRKMTKYCDEDAATALANAAFYNALAIAQEAKLPCTLKQLVGVGVTASLTKGEGEREGRWNGAYIALCIGCHTHVTSIEFDVADGGREDQENKLIEQILNQIYVLTQTAPLNT